MTGMLACLNTGDPMQLSTRRDEPPGSALGILHVFYTYNVLYKYFTDIVHVFYMYLQVFYRYSKRENIKDLKDKDNRLATGRRCASFS